MYFAKLTLDKFSFLFIWLLTLQRIFASITFKLLGSIVPDEVKFSASETKFYEVFIVCISTC